MKGRIKSFDVIRAISTLGIIVYHYSFNYIEYGITGNHPYFAKFPTGDWGSVLVALFFMLSGASLYLGHSKYENPLKFYGKRWLAIFPVFYLAYIPAYIGKSLDMGIWNWGGLRRNFIYTILGVDGYFLNPGYNINYYRIGEWFLGAIVLIYLLYPVIRLSFSNKYSRMIFSLVLFVLFVLNLQKDWFVISDGKNLITCIFNFYIGMWICLYKDNLKNKKIAIAAFVFMVVFMICPVGIYTIFIASLVALFLFIIFLNISDFLVKFKLVDKLVGFYSKNSFAMFLIHHLVIYKTMEGFSHSSLNTFMWIVMLFVNIAAISLAGFMLTICSSFLVKGIKNVISLIHINAEG